MIDTILLTSLSSTDRTESQETIAVVAADIASTHVHAELWGHLRSSGFLTYRCTQN